MTAVSPDVLSKLAALFPRDQIAAFLEEEGYSVSSYAQFQRKYWNDPVGFVWDCVKWPEGAKPAPYQLEMMRELIEYKRAAVKSPHGTGKSAGAALLVHWFALTRDGRDWKLPTTASVFRQLEKFLWPEVRKWGRRLRWDVIGRDPYTRDELMSMRLRLDTGEAFAVASDDPHNIEGAHADHILYIFDEGKAIPHDIWDAAEGAFTGATGNTEVYVFAISTPGEPQGRFFDILRRAPGYEDWKTRSITLEEAIAAGRVSSVWAEQRKKQWGEESAVYRNRVLGEFASAEREEIIPFAWIEAAIDRWQKTKNWGGFTSVGVDVGLGTEGSDQTVFALCYDNTKIKELRKYPRGDPMIATMEIAGRVGGVLRETHGVAIVDIIGIGAGVVQRLRELGRNVIGFDARRKTELLDIAGELGFVNWRSAGWWMLREMLAPESGFNVALPPDDQLIGELTSPHKRETSTSKIQVEDKRSIRRRLRRSTDCADAVIMALTGRALWMAAEQGDRMEVYYMPERIER